MDDTLMLVQGVTLSESDDKVKWMMARSMADWTGRVAPVRVHSKQIRHHGPN